jgi:hypothetical protein
MVHALGAQMPNVFLKMAWLILFIYRSNDPNYKACFLWCLKLYIFVYNLYFRLIGNSDANCVWNNSAIVVHWVELMLWPTISRPICHGVRHPFGAHDQIFLFPSFCQKIALLFVLGCPLWREDGSVICMQSVGGKSRGGLITIHYCLIWTTGFPFRRLLRHTGITVEVF